jgi:ABC-type multidrug transport system fused ATPase/permease subunit
MSAVFRKSMTLSNVSRQTYTAGAISNFFNVNTEPVAQFFTFGGGFGAVVQSTASFCTAVILMARIFKDDVVISVVGLAIMLSYLPLGKYFINVLATFRARILKSQDGRVQGMIELISSMRVIKFYAWEEKFLGKVIDHRAAEHKMLIKEGETSALNNTTSQLSAPLAIAVTLVIYAAKSGGAVDPAKVAAVIGVFNALRQSFQQLPMAMQTYQMMSSGLERISVYLAAKDAEPQDRTIKAGKPAISVQNCDMSWDANDPTPTLKAVSLDIPAGALVAVIGATGSGKSSLIAGIMGEMVSLNCLAKCVCRLKLILLYYYSLAPCCWVSGRLPAP